MSDLRHLVIVLGDQLDLQASAFDDFDATRDAVLMVEAEQESTQPWSAKQRIVMFLSAMRHFAQTLREAGRPLHYNRLDDPAHAGSLLTQWRAAVAGLQPQQIVVTAPGDWRVLQDLRTLARDCNIPLQVREDRHFFCTVREFAAWARNRRGLRMEFFYREQRRRHGILMEGDHPLGGRWNFDSDNRAAFGKSGPGTVPTRALFEPDAITREVIALVHERFAAHPGGTASFAWPVTREQALAALACFINERLPLFGTWQDAMWSGEPWLYHAHLAAAMNLKLLHPREVVAAAVQAHRDGKAPLAAVEGFVRQILGWREYVRGIYWTRMPGYLDMNALDAHQDLPAWYWTGNTPMACLREVITQTLAEGYAHHIQRLMVTGLYALLLGVAPRQVHEWYLAVYVDAVEWVELPNTLGMSQYADGGLMASKPYVATGRYIQRMSPYCKGCRFDPAQSTGESACPFTTLYWDFLMRLEAALADNARMSLQLRNLARLDELQRQAVRERADAIRRGELDGCTGQTAAGARA